MTKQEIENKIKYLLDEARTLGIHYGCECGCGGEQLEEDIEELEEKLKSYPKL